MPRSFWKGTISFGMVAIPVRMSVAAESRTPAFHLLHKKCLTRPKQVLYCQKDDEQFTQKETVRGYEYVKGEYIVLKESDFEKVPVKTMHSIEILGFIGAGEIDPLYYYGSHYLEPEELGVKPFYLLRETLLGTKRAGLAKVAFQRREHLCILRPLDDIMALHTIHYHDEILPRSEIAPSKPKITAAEKDMAAKLVEAMATSFQPEKYQDEYTIALQKMIQAKVDGQEIAAPPPAPEAEIEDLMTALRASLDKAKKVPAAVK
jgi:DNA end-binding protein Ku